MGERTGRIGLCKCLFEICKLFRWPRELKKISKLSKWNFFSKQIFGIISRTLTLTYKFKLSSISLFVLTYWNNHCIRSKHQCCVVLTGKSSPETFVSFPDLVPESDCIAGKAQRMTKYWIIENNIRWN